MERNENTKLFIFIEFFQDLLYFFLTVLGQTEEGLEVIVILAYGVGILMVAATFLVIIISLIEYLRSLE